MQDEEQHASDILGAPGSHHQDTSNKPQLDSRTARRLEELEPLRIDPALIEFPEGAPVFEGGYAKVSRALLGAPSDGTKGRVVESRTGNVKASDQIANLEGDNRRREAEEGNEVADHVAEKGADEPQQEFDSQTSGPRKAVAVKKMKVKSQDELFRVLSLTLREAEVLASLWHENVINLEGFVEDVSKGVIWLVFPWEDNGNLKDFVALHDWEVPERIALIYDVTSGVEYLHTRTPPICHADLKSINILVNSKCRAVLTDFGSAHHPTTNSLNREREGGIKQPPRGPPIEATFSTSTNTITLTGIQCTTRWAAPEVLENDEFSLASDIWALGWVAYEVMTNSIPFHDVKEPVVVNRIVRGDLPSVSTDVRMLLIQELCYIVRLCWNSDSDKRPTAESCRKSIDWMPMVAPSLARTKDATGFVGSSAELLMELGHMCRRQSDYANASKYYTKALDVYIDMADRKGEGDALVELAQIRRFEKRYSEAITSYDKALEIHTDLGDKGGRACALFGLADVHRLRNENSQAVTLYSECLQIRADIGDRRGRASTLLGLAEVHRRRNEYSKAVTFYSECLQILTDIGNRQGRAEALWGLASLHRLRNEYSQAATFYSECLQIRTDIGDRGGRASTLWGLADTHRLQKEYNQAITLFTEALTIFAAIDNKYWSAFTLRNMAHAHRDQGHHRNAIHHYEQAAKLFKQIGNNNGEFIALEQAAGLRRSLEKQGAI